MSRQASGLKAWLVQRITAIYLGLFCSYLVLHFAIAAPADYAAWRAWVAQPLVSLGWLLFIPVLLAHAWVGLRDVLMDYVKPIGLRVALLSLTALVFLASGLWAVRAIILAGLEG
ncbi:succinate dehydrogenase, hydrophobic membrane anchor protein [Thioalkalicoccus limnaeus]|uniref:Succinate dehydrogenase hydrophobic membrane anchor subunit n=1 Tax=Thioalkalicoccus limnaeus TaxID=120681 RepID=A0ABV4BE81_9GAMM